MGAKTTQAKTDVFEENMKMLEERIQKLEDGTLSLDQSLKAFEEGVGLARECQTYLKNAEQKVEILTKKGKDGLEFEPYQDSD